MTAFQVFTPDNRAHRATRMDGKLEGFVVTGDLSSIGLGIFIDIPDTESGSRVIADVARLRAQGLVVTTVGV